MNKKGAMMTVIGMVLAIVGGLFILTLMIQGNRITDFALKEKACRSSNILRLQAKTDAGPLQTPTTLVNCITHSVDLPERTGLSSFDIETQKRIIATKIGEQVAGCGLRFIKGKELKGDVLSEALVKPYGTEFKCFTCAIMHPTSEFVPMYASELDAYFDEMIFSAKTTHDGCDVENQYAGGFCAPKGSCGNGEFEHLRIENLETKGKCYPGEVCCSSSSGCDRLGGRCADSCDGDYDTELDNRVFSSWSCPKNKKCCIRKNNAIYIRDLIEKDRGNPGKLIIDDSLERITKDKHIYVVFMEHQTNIWGLTGWPFTDQSGKIDTIYIADQSVFAEHKCVHISS